MPLARRCRCTRPIEFDRGRCHKCGHNLTDEPLLLSLVEAMLHIAEHPHGVQSPSTMKNGDR
jgi:hypothetical protein